jgi:hypothetical protein
MDFKNINIGRLIQKRVDDLGISSTRVCAFMKCNEKDIDTIYGSNTIDAESLLRWSKLLEYDFFRIYSQHLILYAPSSLKTEVTKNSSLPQFRKNIYTKELIDFILELINTGQKTKNQVIHEYRIPKTTLYKWISKNNVE